MADKDVQRNVRFSSEEGAKTPDQKNYHTLGEKDKSPFGQKRQKGSSKDKLLTKFRKREKKRRKKDKNE